MVQHGFFKLELVDASTKKPFQEHTKDGTVFVEAEKDAEYLISFRKTHFSWPQFPYLHFKFLVDGKELDGLYIMRQSLGFDRTPQFIGPTDFLVNGAVQTNSLKFHLPTRNRTEQKFNLARFLQSMGRVQVQIYQGFPYQEPACPYQRNSTFGSTVPAVNVSQDAGDREKFFLSAKGNTKSVQMATSPLGAPGFRLSSNPGQLLDTITLCYCSVKGLQLVGILPTCSREDLWAEARRRSHKSEAVSPSPPKKKIRYTEVTENIGENDLIHQVKVVHILDDSDSEE